MLRETVSDTSARGDVDTVGNAGHPATGDYGAEGGDEDALYVGFWD